MQFNYFKINNQYVLDIDCFQYIRHRRRIVTEEEIQKKYRNFVEEKYEKQRKVKVTKWTFW